MKHLYSIGCILLLCGSLTAQTPAGRTVPTIVADVLAQLPASKQDKYNQVMKELCNTGEEGVKMLVSMMNVPGKGDNSKVEYALNGMAYYASGEDALKNKMEQAYIAVLDQTNEREIKAFIIRQLTWIGSDVSVHKLAGYLNDGELSSPAACTIASIGGETAAKALQRALMNKSFRSPQAQCDVIQALGDVKPVVEGSEELLKTMLQTDDPTLKEAILTALSKTGSKESLGVLATIAAADGYKAGKVNSANAYVQLIKRVYEQGDTKAAASAAQSLLKNATKARVPHVRNAALELVLLTQHDKLKVLKDALKDSDEAYLNVALAFASDYADKAMYTDLYKTLPKAKTAEKIAILNWLGDEAQCPEKKSILQNAEISVEKTGTQILIQLLDQSDLSIKQAAATALGKIGDKSALPALTDLLKSSDPQVVTIAVTVLASFPADVSPELAKAMLTASDDGKIAALSLLSSRKADAYLNSVLEQTKNASPKVKAAAYSALKNVVSEKDFVVLCGMLETAEQIYIQPLQQAVSASIASMTPAKKAELTIQRMLQADPSKKHVYYLVLADTGDQTALEIIIQGVNKETGASKDAAFEALCAWKDFDAENALYAVCQNASSPYYDKAMKAYIALVSDGKMTGESRLIFMRKAMEAAKTNDQKNEILKQIRKTGTFSGLIYAGTFLDDNALKEEAAQAVMNCALANKNYTGAAVKELLTKAAAALSGPDADYQRQAIRKHLNEMPDETGFAPIFNGKDLTGWKGLVANPIQRAKMKPAAMKTAQAKADEVMRSGWSVINGELVFNGRGDNICTEKQYGDFEMYVDWKLDPAGPEADAGIYLRGTPQVQIWDTSRVNVGAQVGSGGLYNNQTYPSKPLQVADNPLGEWNTCYIKMVGDRVTVLLNGVLVVDNVVMENYWDRSQPIPAVEQLELQAHGSKVYYRNIYVKELTPPEPYRLTEEEKKEGFEILFDGTHMHEWTGNLVDYKLEDGCISLGSETKHGGGGNLYTKKEYANFVYRFEFQLTPAANNGIGIRTPVEGDAAYFGMEIQVLDSEHSVYKNLAKYQYHGSVYGIIPAKRGYLKPVGEWNTQEIMADGNRIKVTLNGTVILDGDLKEATANGTMDGREHPGLFNKSGRIAFLGHGSAVKFRNIRIRELK
jgi:HEAT repeat protein